MAEREPHLPEIPPTCHLSHQTYVTPHTCPFLSMPFPSTNKLTTRTVTAPPCFRGNSGVVTMIGEGRWTGVLQCPKRAGPNKTASGDWAKKPNLGFTYSVRGPTLLHSIFCSSTLLAVESLMNRDGRERRERLYDCCLSLNLLPFLLHSLLFAGRNRFD